MDLLTAAAGGYHMKEDVHRRLCYPGQLALTLPRGGFGGEDLVDPVLKRGPIYRKPPPEDENP